MRRTVTGLRAWLLQRISAIYMLLCIIFFLTHFIVEPPDSYQAWHGWMMRSGVSIATAIFFAALLLHVWVGVRDVLMDYIHPLALRVPALTLLGIGLMAMMAWVIRILLMKHS